MRSRREHPKNLLKFGRLNRETRESLARFDEFDYFKGEPAVFEVEGRTFEVSVREDNISNAVNVRRIEAEEKGVRGMSITAGFIDELIFIKDRISSGNHGWVGVINYPEIYEAVNPNADIPDDEYSHSMWAYKDMLVKQKGKAAAHRITALARHSDLLLLERIVDPQRAFRGMVKVGGEEGRDYTKDGVVMKKLFEFLGRVSAPGICWRLFSIAHAGTARKLLDGVPFSKTGYGSMVGAAGWEDTTPLVSEYERKMPKGLKGAHLRSELLSPVVRRVEDHVLTSGWVGFQDRLTLL